MSTANSIAAGIADNWAKAIEWSSPEPVRRQTIKTLLKRLKPEQRVAFVNSLPEVQALQVEIVRLHEEILEMRAGFDYLRNRTLGKKGSIDILRDFQAKDLADAKKMLEKAEAAVRQGKRNVRGAKAFNSLIVGNPGEALDQLTERD